MYSGFSSEKSQWVETLGPLSWHIYERFDLTFRSLLALELLILAPHALFSLASLSFTHYALRSSGPIQLLPHRSPLASSFLQKHENVKTRVYFGV